MLFLDLPLAFFGLLLFFVVILLLLLFLQCAGLNYFFHLLVVDQGLDLHIFGMLLLLALELQPPLFDLFLSQLELMVQFIQSLLVALSGLLEFLLLLLPLDVGLLFLLFVKEFHHPDPFGLLLLHLLLPLHHLLLLFLQILFLLHHEGLLFGLLLLLH